MTGSPRARAFTYRSLDIDEASGAVVCRYALDDVEFVERIDMGPGGDWGPAARQAARLVFLLAGVSYYKAGAPPVVDLGTTPVRPGEVDVLRSYYRDGLGEFAYRNDLDLDDLAIRGGTPVDARVPTAATSPDRPLIPFGGGLDSIVTVELIRDRVADPALFVVSRGEDRFAAIEDAAAATGLPVLRAGRWIDTQILTSAERGWLNGHVPVTGIISAIAVLAAVLDGRGLVVMSNEWSASSATLRHGDREVNHQWSKGLDFERAFAGVVDDALGGSVSYFSELRPFTELWIAERFSHLERYHPVFRSCNRAFHLDPDRRLDHWCGRCDKCCFIDLILAPWLAPSQLEAIFGGREPLRQPDLAERFRTLLATSAEPKPFECVGDTGECRTALALTARRTDRAGDALVGRLAGELGRDLGGAADDAPTLLLPVGPHHIPDALLPADLVG